MARTPLTFNAMVPLARAAVAGTPVPAALVLAVARHESGGFFPGAHRSESHLADGSHGLMQLLYSTARGAGYRGEVGAWNEVSRTGTGLYDPATNLRYGALHLNDLFRATGGDVERSVSAYNAGLGNARKATVATRFCEEWKSDAPATGRLLDRDCKRIRLVHPGEWMNQPYVDVVMRYYREALSQLGAVPVVPSVPVGSVGGSRPAGAPAPGLPSSPSDGSAPVFVVRPAVAILVAVAAVIAWLARR